MFSPYRADGNCRSQDDNEGSAKQRETNLGIRGCAVFQQPRRPREWLVYAGTPNLQEGRAKRSLVSKPIRDELRCGDVDRDQQGNARL